MRDEVLPVLPGYTRWLAGRSRGDGDELAELGERLWDDLHALVRALEADAPDFDSIRSEPPPTADDPHPLSLAERLARVRKGYDGLVRGFAVGVRPGVEGRLGRRLGGAGRRPESPVRRLPPGRQGRTAGADRVGPLAPGSG